MSRTWHSSKRDRSLRLGFSEARWGYRDKLQGLAGLLVTNVHKYIGLPRAVVCLIPATCLPGRLEPGVLRPYRHVLQREGRRAQTHHTMTSCLYVITISSGKSILEMDFKAKFEIVLSKCRFQLLFMQLSLQDRATLNLSTVGSCWVGRNHFGAEENTYAYTYMCMSTYSYKNIRMYLYYIYISEYI